MYIKNKKKKKKKAQLFTLSSERGKSKERKTKGTKQKENLNNYSTDLIDGRFMKLKSTAKTGLLLFI